MLSRQHPAGGEYILASGSPYGTGDSVVGQPIPEVFHDDLRRSLERGVRDLVEADKVHPAFQTGQQPDYGIGMTLVIIEPENIVYSKLTRLCPLKSYCFIRSTTSDSG